MAVVTPATRGTAATDEPTILLAGGPGQGAIDTVLDVFDLVERSGREPPSDTWWRQRLAEATEALEQWRVSMVRRPLVLLDQRGTGYSRPSLDCPDGDPGSCRTRLLRAGVDLAAYTTVENAHDVDAVRRALGHERVNLDGGSYGTLLGLEVLRRHGDRVRAAVLESVVTPQLSLEVEAVRRYGQALDVLFRLCAADAECDAGYPGLRATFYDAVARLDRSPLVVNVPSPAAPTTLTGQVLRRLVWQGLLDRDPVPWLPGLIVDAGAGRTAGVAEFLVTLGSTADNLAEGMQLSVNCPTRATLTEADLQEAARGLHPAIRAQVVADHSHLIAACRLWDVPAAAAVSLTPVTSDRPVLLLSGELDPATPPANADLAATTLRRAVTVVLPGLGHTDGLFTPCGQRLRTGFLDNPDAPLDTTCVVTMPAMRFVVPAR